MHSQPWFRQRSLSGYIVCLQRQPLAAMTRKSQTQSLSKWHSETDIEVLLPSENSWFLRTEFVELMAGVGIEFR